MKCSWNSSCFHTQLGSKLCFTQNMVFSMCHNCLRIPDSYHAKTLKIHTPLVRFALYFHYRAVFQKFEIFERRSSYKIISQNVSGGSDFQWFLHHNYLVSLRPETFFTPNSIHMCSCTVGHSSQGKTFSTHLIVTCVTRMNDSSYVPRSQT